MRQRSLCEQAWAAILGLKSPGARCAAGAAGTMCTAGTMSGAGETFAANTTLAAGGTRSGADTVHSAGGTCTPGATAADSPEHAGAVGTTAVPAGTPETLSPDVADAPDTQRAPDAPGNAGTMPAPAGTQPDRATSAALAHSAGTTAAPHRPDCAPTAPKSPHRADCTEITAPHRVDCTPIIAVSAKTGAGLHQLRQILNALAAAG